jgi:transcriptional regulator with XRE-family HTH domain
VTHRQRLAENLRRHLESTGMTQTALANACGMAQPRISDVLTARYAVTVDTVERIERALGVPSGSLLLAPSVPVQENSQISTTDLLTSIR